MAMITELDLQEQVVKGGEKIAVFKWTLSNVHIHQVANVVSRLQLALIESDSNNTTGQMILHNSASFNAEWGRVKSEWDRAIKWKDLAPAAQEKILSVLAATDNEILRTVNEKCQRVCYALQTLLHKMCYCDSAKLQYGIGPADQAKIQQQMEYVEDVLTDYLGTGTSGDDIGRDVPAFEHLGVVIPPLNLHEAQVQEPSPAAPTIPAPDAPDTESTVPKPGSNTRA